MVGTGRGTKSRGGALGVAKPGHASVPDSSTSGEAPFPARAKHGTEMHSGGPRVPPRRLARQLVTERVGSMSREEQEERAVAIFTGIGLNETLAA